MGNLHNRGLDQILTDLQKASEKDLDRSGIYELVEGSMRTFLQEQNVDIKALDSDVIATGMAWFRNAPRDDDQAAVRSPASGLKVLPDSVLSKMTPGQKRYVREIYDLIKGELSLNELKEKLATLNTSAREELGADEMKPVLYASAVAKSSAAYWHEHYRDWIAALLRATSDSLVKRSGGAVAGRALRAPTSARYIASDPTDLCDVGYHAEYLGQGVTEDGEVVDIYTCELNTAEPEEEGFWGSLSDVLWVDAGAAVGVAVTTLAGPVGAGVAATATLGASAGQGVNEYREWLNDDNDDSNNRWFV